MADNLIPMQHVSKGPAGFTHGHTSVESDEEGIVSVPSQFVDFAKAHGFSTNVGEKAAPKVLRKDVKETEGDKAKSAGGK